jgi:biotin--protein ligase
VLKSLEDLVGDKEFLKDEHDTFKIEKLGAYNMGTLAESLPADSKEGSSESSQTEGIVDYQSIVKRLVIHDDVPSSKLTPYFNHHAFYSHLRDYQAQSKEGASLFGSNILYGEVVTSTNTILEK